MAMSESTFKSYLAQILSARYGEEVRGSIHDSLQGMYDIVKQNTLDVSAASKMMAAADSLNKIKTDATNAANAANTAASNLNKLKTDASNAANAANTAASNANKAVSNANSAIKKANDAAAAANNAVLTAQSATSNANAAASKATTATSKANEAKQAAIDAANSVNEAKQAAIDAANSVEEAKTAATEAAGKVDAAIKKAETATTQANTARDAANTAKSEADKATNRANDAAAIIETLDLGDINTGEIATKRYVREQIDGIDIGGTNLLTGSKDFLGEWYNSTLHEDDVSYNGFSVKKRKDLWRGISKPLTVTANEEYTLSAYVKVDNPVDVRAYAVRPEDDHALTEIYTNYITDQCVANKWVRVHQVFSVKKDGIAYFRIESANTENGYVYVCGMKVERGNKPTDWSPAPEDVDATIDGIQVGGRNLIRNSRSMSSYYNIGVTISADDEGYAIASWPSVETANWNNNVSTFPPIPYSAVKDKTVTFSVDVRSADAAQINADDKHGLYITFSLCTSSSTVRTRYKGMNQYAVTLATGWKRITLTADISDEFFSQGTGTDSDTRFFIQLYDYSTYRMEMRRPKLELGNKATDWSPAPEDSLSIDGGTLNGDIKLSGDKRAISYKSSNRDSNLGIVFYGGNDKSGNGIVIGDGGRTIIGGGESANALHDDLNNNGGLETNENMHVSSDQNVYVHSNCNKISNRKTFTFGSDGKFYGADGIAYATTARVDYIGMMTGIDIPTDTVVMQDETVEVQTDFTAMQAAPQSIEDPGLEEPAHSEPAHSEKFDTVKLYYDAGAWNEQMVKNAIGKWITKEESEKIINKKEA